jgi:glycerophosphoryl diester phosphodiesterase
VPATLPVVEIIAHRGASWDAPENTLSSAKLAWTQGADALELDLHLTKDSELVVIHDEDLRRVAGDPRAVAATTFAELRTLDVGRWKNAQFEGEKIPTLKEVLSTMPGAKRIFIEIKGGPEVVDALDRCLADSKACAGSIVIISFDRFAVQVAKRAMPQFEACWIIDSVAAMNRISIDAILRVARDLGIDGLDFESQWPLDAKTVQQIHRQGFKAYVWTVDDALLAGRLLAAGIDGITTNRPGWLRAQLSLSQR